MAVPTINGERRPKRSESEPWVSWPTASPTNQVASVICAEPSGVRSDASMAGKAGRYMSVEIGPTAVRKPRRIGNQEG